MFQDNPLLIQLKEHFHSHGQRIEGVIKGTGKGFGFLEASNQKSYLIPRIYMKKVMHGDRVIAMLHLEQDREVAEPKTLIKPFLSRFIGRVHRRAHFLFIVPSHPLLKDEIQCQPVHTLTHNFQSDDFAVAQMRCHPLKGDRYFNANLIHFISDSKNHLTPWWVILARYNLEKEAPEMMKISKQKSVITPEDLTKLNFITIDSASTKDIDDALFVSDHGNNSFQVTIAIADPTTYIKQGSPLDNIARTRAFTNYLPGCTIPMLPRDLSDNLCSLRPNECRQVLACRFIISSNGALSDDIQFFMAKISSKGKLVYDEVSDWLEGIKGWQPKSEAIAQQLILLQRVFYVRNSWRHQYALVCKDRPDYHFVLSDKGELIEILQENRRVANKIVEECMIAANICAAKVLRDHFGFGIYNVHTGFDRGLVKRAVSILKNNGVEVAAETLLDLKGFCDFRRHLDSQPTRFLESLIRRFQSAAEIRTTPGPHFGLGLDVYATWTSPIRKYGDMINHRLLKSIIHKQPVEKPKDEITVHIAERRRLNRLAERDINNWLYACYLKKKAGTDQRFMAEILYITRGGIRVRLLDNGAIAFIPFLFMHDVRDEIKYAKEAGTVQINGKVTYRQSDNLLVTITKVCIETSSVIARPAF